MASRRLRGPRRTSAANGTGDSGQDGASLPSWMRRGKSAEKLYEKEEQRIQADRAQFFRFRMDDGDTTRITFLTGELDEDGILDCPVFPEHRLFNGRRPRFVVCLDHGDEPQRCPLCEAGNRPSNVALFLIVDHTKGKSRAGKTFHHQLRILAAKPQTKKKLQLKAKKLGGLAGYTFEVSRTGDRSPSVGDDFEAVGDRKSLETIAKAVAKAKADDVEGRKKVYKSIMESVPPDWPKQSEFLTEKQMIAAGLGEAPSGPGFEENGDEDPFGGEDAPVEDPFDDEGGPSDEPGGEEPGPGDESDGLDDDLPF